MKRSHALTATSAILAGMIAASAAQAGGTAPGTPISNSFDLTYFSGGDNITITDVDAAEIDVDRKVEYTFSSTDTPKIRATLPGESDVIRTFEVTNTGNAATEFDVDVNQVFVGGNGIELAYDPSGSGAPNTWMLVTIDPDIGPTSAQPYDPASIQGLSVGVDETMVFALVANFGDVTNGDQDNFTLTMRPVEGGSFLTEDRAGAPKIVFNTPQGDGSAFDTAGYVIQAPVITATKTVAVVREQPGSGFNCATQGTSGDGELFLPGACIEYRIEISNDQDANAPAENMTFTDMLPANFQYEGVMSSGIFVADPTGQLIEAEIDGDLNPGDTVWLAIRGIMN